MLPDDEAVAEAILYSERIAGPLAEPAARADDAPESRRTDSLFLRRSPPPLRSRAGAVRFDLEVDALASQLSLELAHVDVAWSRARGRSESGRDSGGLTGEPALRDLAHEGLRRGVGGGVPAWRKEVVELGGENRAVRNRDRRELRRRRGRDAD